MAAHGVRSSAAERREDVLAAAVEEFARGGLEGTSTEVIARRAGISQPYLFRLFPTKKALFVAAVERTFAQISDTFRAAVAQVVGDEAREAMGKAYGTLLVEQPTVLQLQLHAYAVSARDEDVRQVVRRELTRLWDLVVGLGGMSEQLTQAFFAHGMLCNLMGALGISYDCVDTDDPLSIRLTADPAYLAQLAAAAG